MGWPDVSRIALMEDLAAVDEFEPDYQQAIRTPRPQGPETLLAAQGVLGGEGQFSRAADNPILSR